MTNKILKITLVLSLVTLTLLQAESKYEIKYHNNTVNITSSENDKIFIREYKYNASDTDSKVSSRKKAIAELKNILSEEVGVLIESSLEMKNTVRNGVNNKYFKSEINQLSASITKLKILDEKWNGVTYYIKASVKVNEEQTMKLLLEAIKAKSSKKDIIRLNKILKEQNSNLDKSYSKIQQLQKKLVLQEIKNQASKDELTDTKNILQKLKKQKQKYDNKVIKQKSEIGKIKRLVQKAKNRIKKDTQKACLLTVGMTKNEILSTIGNPSSDNYSVSDNQYMNIDNRYSNKWYYGKVIVLFNNNLISNIRGCR